MTVALTRRTLLLLAGALLVLALGITAQVTPVGREATAFVFPAGRTADPATLAAQGEAIERAIGRSYLKAIEQLRKVRELRLPVSDAEADAIEARGVARLKEVRRAALVAVAETFGLAEADRERYAAGAEARIEGPAQPSPEPVLLAPRLAQIATRAGELSAQIADETTRSLTQPAATASPGASPRRASPSPSGR